MADQPFMPHKISLRPTEQLVPYAQNAKEHTPEQVARIAASIRRFGFLVPIVTDHDGALVAGHGRLLAAQQLELQQVPTIDAGHLTPDEVRAYRIADNRLAEGKWLDDLLRCELEALQAADMALVAGFTPDEVDHILTSPSVAEAQARILANKVDAESEILPQAVTAADIAQRGADLLHEAAAKHPDAFTRAEAVILPVRGSRDLLILHDPATADIVAELRRYAEAGELETGSPLAELFKAICPLAPPKPPDGQD